MKEDIVLEVYMFKHPPQWGRRVIQRGNEILLQTTEDRGKTWIDAPIPEVSLMLPEMQLRTTSNNPYSGLIFKNKEKMQLQSMNTLSNNSERQINPKMLEAVASGRLLSMYEKEVELPNNQKQGLETITFMGVYETEGLRRGYSWVDSEGYLRICL